MSDHGERVVRGVRTSRVARGVAAAALATALCATTTGLRAMPRSVDVRYAPQLRAEVGRAGIAVLLPSRLPREITAHTTGPRPQAIAPGRYTVTWSAPGCTVPSCVRFAVVGGAEPPLPGGTAIRLDRATMGFYRPFACPLHCEPETLAFTRRGVRYALASSTPLGAAVLRIVYASLETIRP